MTGWVLDSNDNEKEPKRCQTCVVWAIGVSFSSFYILTTVLLYIGYKLLLYPSMGMGPTGLRKPVTRTHGNPHT